MILRGAEIVDGTRRGRFAADVLVRDGRVAAIEAPSSFAGAHDDIVDLDGLVLAPGFIDLHTHYDAQVLWDPDLTPSPWHGVTSVVTGNCGFGIAPTRAGDRETILRTLENVEGMSLEALSEGLSGSFDTFGTYLEAVRATPLRINVTAMVGHTPVRQFVMGADATSRGATAAEVDAMIAVVEEAATAGAVGFATSKLTTHVGAYGRPVPSRLADYEEVEALAGVFGSAGHGIIQAAAGAGLFVEDLTRLATATGRPVTWTALLTGIGGVGRTLELLDRQSRAGGDVYPQISCRPLVMQINLFDPFPFSPVPAFSSVLEVDRAQRAAIYRDASWRATAKAQLGDEWTRRWPKTFVEETVNCAELVGGPSIAEIARETGLHPFDVLCDVSLRDDLHTRFRIVLANDDEAELAHLLRDDRTILGLSDAGAHASQLCDACFSTHLLGHWVRDRGVLSLEDAVWRLTGQPAAFLEWNDRGTVTPGAVADLVAFDLDAVGPGVVERRHDFPAGADRLVALGKGIEYLWIAGTAVRESGRDIPGIRPGTLLGGARP